jgi:hypothetical protein
MIAISILSVRREYPELFLASGGSLGVSRLEKWDAYDAETVEEH